ncbi:MAG: MCE family protein [Lewinellaceae bacterium]|nr:MCE family protein [Lewinellaceae bacterium]
MFKISNEIKVALLAISAVALGIWGFKFLKGINVLTTSKTFYVKYENVQELHTSAPVFIRGLQVGMVKDIFIDKQDDRTIIVVLNIERGFDVPKNAIATLTSPTFMGGRAIELIFYRGCEGDDCAESGDYLEGDSRSFLAGMIEPGEIDRYTQRLREGLAINLDSLAQANPESMAGSLVALDNALKNIEIMTYKINKLLDATASSMTQTMQNAAIFSQALSSNKDEIGHILNNLDTLSRQLKDAGIDQSAHKAGEALDTLTANISNLRYTLNAAERTISRVDTLAQNLVNGKGIAGKMLTDEQLAEDLERTIRHTQLLLQDFRLNPKRYTTVKLKVFGKNKTKGYATPFDDPIYQMQVDSLERALGKRLREQDGKGN